MENEERKGYEKRLITPLDPHRKKPKGFETWLTTIEAALQYGVTDAAIRHYVRHQRVNCKKIGGRWYIDPESLARIFPDAERGTDG